MKLYPYQSEDTSPDACRSSGFQGEVLISRTPCRTNMSNEIRTEGWCGTTNDISIYALGVVDTADDNWVEQLRDLLPERASFDADELVEWMTSDLSDLVGEDDFACDWDNAQESEAFTWDPDDEDAWWPEEKSGWTQIAYQGEGMATHADCIPEDLREWDDITRILDSAGIHYDDACWESFGVGGYSGWRAIAIRVEDEDAAEAAFEAAVEDVAS